MFRESGSFFAVIIKRKIKKLSKNDKKLLTSIKRWYIINLSINIKYLMQHSNYLTYKFYHTEGKVKSDETISQERLKRREK